MLHPTLEQILLKFRTYRVALNGDISKMYREILLAPADQHYHRFLWRETPELEIKDYCMKRVTFGVASSPYAAVRTLQQASSDFGADFPLAQKHICGSFYVDDLLGGADTEEEALELYQQIATILSKAGFTLRKIRSSSSWLLNQISSELVESTHCKELIDCYSAAYEKALGVVWRSNKDVMGTDVGKPYSYVPTKRGILSDVAKTFDVMGWITLVILPMKLMIQELWKSKRGWDDPVSEEQAIRHKTWRDELSQLLSITIPRCYFEKEPSKDVCLHVFCDASMTAYGAVAYLRSTYENGTPTCRLVMAKSKVAPLATRTLPQLELCAAVLLTQVVENVRKAIKIPIDKVTAWGDSTVVLCWLTKSTCDYETFVANRLTTVTSCVPASHWHHVPTTENPADCASRGITAEELKTHSLWWNGPPWLSDEPITMPRQPLEEELEKQKDEHMNASIAKASCLAVCSAPPPWLVTRTMSFRTLAHVAAWMKRAMHNFKAPLRHQPLNKDKLLTVEEVKEATLFLLKRAQLRSYNTEVNGLTAHPPQPIPETNKLINLKPFLDEKGLIRIGGRLKKSQLPYSQKHPILLSVKDPLTRVIFHSKHISMSHCGPTLLLSSVGTEYFVTGAKRLAQNICQTCVVCKKIAATAEQQLMGDLPAERITESQGFHTVGIDYAGPFPLKTSKLRRAPKIDSYLAIFVCFATKGVHIEVVTGLTTTAFLDAMKRFVGRRSLPKHIYSDNGSNFKGAKRDLEELYQWMETTDMSNCLRSYFLDNRTTWHTIPERAPHFGGLWESAVKSTKCHLKRVIGEQSLTYEEMNTVVIQIEACLNSRPLLEQHSHNTDGVQPITPAHLLIGKPLKAYPEAEVDHKITCRGRWIMCQEIVQSFWRRWSQEYLIQLQRRNKWIKTQPNLIVGDLVLMKDSSYFSTHWGLAKVCKTYPGEDGLVRAVDVTVCRVTLPDEKGNKKISPNQMKVKKTTLRRPVTKLALLLRNEVNPSLGGECSGT